MTEGKTLSESALYSNDSVYPAVLANARDEFNMNDQASIIKYEFTKDEDLLEQYYKLRGKMYAIELGLDDFPCVKDEYDDDSDILVIREGSKVLGGVRITMVNEGERLMPMESEDYKINDLIPELGLNDVTYGEFSRLAILPEYRKENLETIIGMIGNMGRKHNAKYLFAIAPLAQARMYRMYRKNFGFDLEIREDIGLSAVAKKWGLNMPLLIFREGNDKRNDLE